jgi:hypothetical protein
LEWDFLIKVAERHRDGRRWPGNELEDIRRTRGTANDQSSEEGIYMKNGTHPIA